MSNAKIDPTNSRLGRRLVFDDEIAAQQRMPIRPNFGRGRGSGAAGNSREAGLEQSRVGGKGPSG